MHPHLVRCEASDEVTAGMLQSAAEVPQLESRGEKMWHDGTGT